MKDKHTDLNDASKTAQLFGRSIMFRSQFCNFEKRTQDVERLPSMSMMDSNNNCY